MRSIPFIYHTKHNTISKAYAVLVGKPYVRQFVAKIKFNEYVSKFKFKSLLDLGCDDGEYSFYIEKKYKEVVIDAIDTYKESIDFCDYVKKKVDSNVHFENIEIGQVKKKYDLILLMGALSFNLDDKSLMKNIDKHLEKNGILYVREAYSDITKPKKIPEDTKFTMIRYGYNKKTMELLLRGTKLKLVTFERYCGGFSNECILMEGKILRKSSVVWSLIYLILKPLIYIQLKLFDNKKEGIEIACVIKKM